MMIRYFLLAVLALCGVCVQSARADWLAGFSRIDVTPTEPVRMSGYGNRDHPSEGIDTPLYVRCLALKSPTAADASLLISVDTIGLPGSLTRRLAEQIQELHSIPRSQVVFCSTHTHCGPDLVSGLANLFATELSEDEVAAGTRYRQQLLDGILQSAEVALQDLAPAKLGYAVGEATFAANRRVVKDGRWTGFGVQADGPVDHTVPVLRITDDDGKVRGVVFNYACHCTTLGGDHYRINADWAGYATTNLEAKYPDAVALCTIGCGADANPEPRGSLDATKVHGRTLATEVARLLAGEMKTVDAPLDARFDYAGLSFDLPTQEELESRAEHGSSPQERRHAKQMLEVLEEHGRLPATYPVPIQSWKFGDQLTMIFLGGEVVVDYALRLKKTLDDPALWVSCYANDVMGYIASERIRNEGGYEFDRSGIYYGLPGVWATGTEDLLVRRIEDLLRTRGRSRPIAASDTIKNFSLTDGYEIDLVAAEPLVQDPINIAFGSDGRLWVVEMGDYPEGDGEGRVKVLTDADGDGVFDKSAKFLGDLPHPTGVFPWRDGVLISAAPDILFARDSDGDDVADDVQTLYTGFRLANPQHRVSGFSYGLDHSLHLAAGDNLSEITCVKTGQKVNASGHDVQIWPDSGKINMTSGRTQYIRSRNDWGQWFGNDNSRPMYHFPIEDAYLDRNDAVSYSGSSHQLFDPPVAPPVFPRTSATERFNDLFAANRFTSACSAIVVRAPRFQFGDQDAALICEPVHNLVHRAMLTPDGSTFAAVRSPQEAESEFLTSTDPWFRPVRAIVGPDGSLYIVDMYRETIEHPEWIPESWQAQLDLYAGSDRGRIYRVRPSDAATRKSNPLGSQATKGLIRELQSPIGARRDMAQQLILERKEEIKPDLVLLAQDRSNPHARVHALSILAVRGELENDILVSALQDSHPGVLLVAIPLAESRMDDSQILQQMTKIAESDNHQVLLQAALALGQTDAAEAGRSLAKIAVRPDLDRWLVRAITASATHHAETILAELLRHSDRGTASDDLLSNLLVTAHTAGVDIAKQFGATFESGVGEDVAAEVRLAASFVSALQSAKAMDDRLVEMFRPLYGRATAIVSDGQVAAENRCEALSLIGLGIGSAANEKKLLLDLLRPVTPPSVQQEAIDRLAAFADDETCQELVDRWGSMTTTVRDHCVSRMLQRRKWTEQLLDAIEDQRVQVKDLNAAARQQLTHTGSRSMRVRAQRLTRMTGTAEKQDLVRNYLSAIVESGNVARGEALFKQHCAVCHVASPDGEAVGASLENLTDRSDQALLTAILDPNAAVDPKYQSYVLQTDDDRILVGTIEQEVGQSVTLAHADGKRTTIRRNQIEGMRNSGVSLMPEGLEAQLPPDAMSDLLEYLQSAALRQPSTAR